MIIKNVPFLHNYKTVNGKQKFERVFVFASVTYGHAQRNGNPKIIHETVKAFPLFCNELSH